MVLSDEGDDEIYSALHAHLVNLDGQRSPLRHAPQAIGSIRHLVAGV